MNLIMFSLNSVTSLSESKHILLKLTLLFTYLIEKPIICRHKE